MWGNLGRMNIFIYCSKTEISSGLKRQDNSAITLESFLGILTPLLYRNEEIFLSVFKAHLRVFEHGRVLMVGLKRLRAQLEELESAKNSLTEDEESVRKALIQKVADKNKSLEESVSLRIEHLTVATQRFETLVTRTGGSDDIDEVKRLYIGPHCGRDSALALAWLEIYGDKYLETPPIDRPTRVVLNKHYAAINIYTSHISILVSTGTASA